MKKMSNLIYMIALLIFCASCKRGNINIDEAIPSTNAVNNVQPSENVPFLAKGIFGVNIPDMRRTAAYGFNVIQSYQFSTMSDNQIALYMDSAAKYNLKVHFHLGVKTFNVAGFEKVKGLVNKFKSHPNLYSWYLSDEPSVKEISISDLKTVYDWIKSADPAHKVYTSNWELENFKSALDFDMPQFYNGPPSALRKGNYLNGYMERAARLGVNWIAIANTHDCIDFAAYHLPGAETISPSFLRGKVVPQSPEDLKLLEKIRIVQANLQNPPFQTLATLPDSRTKVRGQLWDLIARGSNGIWYWLLQPEDSLNERWGYYTFFVRPALRSSLVETMKELTDLWPRVHTPLQNSTTFFEGPEREIFFWMRKSGNQLTVIAVNESEKALTVQTSITPLAAYPSRRFQVNNENRTVEVVNGQLIETFQPNETHIYTLTL